MALLESLVEIAVRFWWVLAIIVLLIGFYVWKGLDAYTQFQLKKVFSGNTLLFLAIVVGWYVWNKIGEMVTLSSANRWMPIIILFILVGRYFIGTLRYETQQFVSPNFHGSYSKGPYRVDGYLIYPIDSFSASGIVVDTAKRIAVVREETAELLEQGSVSIANLSQVSKYELPEGVFQFISNNKYFKKATDQVYYGWFDSIEKEDWEFGKLKQLREDHADKKIWNMLKKELEVDNPKISTLYWLYRNILKSVNKQTEWYDATIDSTEKGVEHQGRVKKALGPDKPAPTGEGGAEENY